MPASSPRPLSPCPPGLSKSAMKAISAPYNFVPLASWVHIPEWGRQVSHDWPFQDGYSGEIHYRLIAESPLLVGGKQDKRERHDAPHTQVRPFQLPDGRYAIPGSSLKGLIRAVVEIIGFGRMRMVDDACPGLRDISGPYVKKAYTDRVRNRVKAGFLRLRDDGGREIVPARMVRLPHAALETAFGLKDAIFKRGQNVAQKYQRWCELCRQQGWRPDRIRFDIGEAGEAESIGEGRQEGFPVFTGQISDSRQSNGKGKKRDFIFYDKDESQSPLQVSDDVWRDFLHIHGDDEPAKSGMPWPSHWKQVFRCGEDVPVFYLNDGGKIRIGLAYMPKLAGDFGIHDCIDHVSADHLKIPPGVGRYDLADLLFGAINGDEQKDALRGRVSFETAKAIGDPKPVQAPDTILNSPKPTYFPNYLRQQTDKSTRKLEGGERAQYATYVRSSNNPAPQIRGFKRYPARPEGKIGVQALTKEQQSNKKVQIRLHPLPEGTVFDGRITFHNLKPQELGALLWALTWGGDEGLRHSLGMGKPFGFGQVRFEIDGNESRLVPNDPAREEVSLTEGKQRELMEAFENHMEEAAEKHGGWRDSPQLHNLLAMGDPESADKLPNGMQLRHMCLDSKAKINEFVKAKQSRLVLADYAVASKWVQSQKKRRQRIQQEQVRRQAEAERQRQEEERRRLQQEYDALPPHEKARRNLQKTLDSLPDRLRKDQYQQLVSAVNRYLEKARGWEKEDRERAADFIESIYDRFGWGEPGRRSNQRRNQERKKREDLERLRGG